MPAGLPDEGYVALLGADGADLDALAALADHVRQQAVGDAVSYVVNRNLDTATVAGRAPAARRHLTELVVEARELGATEICMQGPLPASADDDYIELIAAITAAAPIHLHAFRVEELLDGAARRRLTLPQFLTAAVEAGLRSVPGTAARILDDGVRTRMNGGPDTPVATWIRVIEAAHRAGLTSTSTMVYGHIETPAQQVTHLRTLAAIQARTGGFTEFIAMPIVPATTPPALRGLPGLGSSWRQTRALYAVARLILHGQIDNLQVAWPKLGLAAAVPLLGGGANDLGGLLLDGRLDPAAGAEAGKTLTLDTIAAIARRLGRPIRQRTTRYGDV